MVGCSWVMDGGGRSGRNEGWGSADASFCGELSGLRMLYAIGLSVAGSSVSFIKKLGGANAWHEVQEFYSIIGNLPCIVPNGSCTMYNK